METEKKGDFLNQIAIISELVENINFECDSKAIVFDLEKDEFERIYELIQSKINKQEKNITNKFSIKVGEVDFVFNRNNV